jgi:hypothetical protein
MKGAYPSGDMIARDGKSVITDPDVFGKEWQVQSTEPMIFSSAKGAQHPEACAMPSMEASAGRKARRLGEAVISKEAAALACAQVDEDDRDSCIYDVLATNDTGMASAFWISEFRTYET